MTPQQKGLLGGAVGRINRTLDTLHNRAARGTRAKPTVAELNGFLKDLEFARDQIENAVAQRMVVTEAMVQRACFHGYGTHTDEGSNLHKVMTRALKAVFDEA